MKANLIFKHSFLNLWNDSLILKFSLFSVKIWLEKIYSKLVA